MSSSPSACWPGWAAGGLRPADGGDGAHRFDRHRRADGARVDGLRRPGLRPAARWPGARWTGIRWPAPDGPGLRGAGGTGQGATGQGTTSGFAGGRVGGGGLGGLLGATDPSNAVVAALSADASSYSWVAASVEANNAAGYQLATKLATGDPVMPIGGFNGSDPSPTLSQFQAYVDGGRIHWFIGGGMGMGSAGGSNAASEITTWWPRISPRRRSAGSPFTTWPSPPAEALGG